MAEQVQTVFQNYMSLYKKDMGIPDMYYDMIDYGIWWQDRDQYLEIDGIAQALGIPTKDAIMINYIFQFDSFCTSLVVKQ